MRLFNAVALFTLVVSVALCQDQAWIFTQRFSIPVRSTSALASAFYRLPTCIIENNNTFQFSQQGSQIRFDVFPVNNSCTGAPLGTQLLDSEQPYAEEGGAWDFYSLFLSSTTVVSPQFVFYWFFKGANSKSHSCHIQATSRWL